MHHSLEPADTYIDQLYNVPGAQSADCWAFCLRPPLICKKRCNGMMMQLMHVSMCLCSALHVACWLILDSKTCPCSLLVSFVAVSASAAYMTVARCPFHGG
jgi:hypothetical protein